MSDFLHEPSTLHEPGGTKTPTKAALASWIGSAVEYYDFFLYGTAAALVFPKLFFPTSDPSTARSRRSPRSASPTPPGRSARSCSGTSATASVARRC